MIRNAEKNAYIPKHNLYSSIMKVREQGHHFVFGHVVSLFVHIVPWIMGWFAILGLGIKWRSHAQAQYSEAVLDCFDGYVLAFPIPRIILVPINSRSAVWIRSAAILISLHGIELVC
jgi:hypothetical protein